MNMFLEIQAAKGVKNPSHYNRLLPREQQGETRAMKQTGYRPRRKRAAHHEC